MNVLQEDELNKRRSRQSVSELRCRSEMHTSDPSMCDECSMRQLQHVLTTDQQPYSQSSLGHLCSPCTHTLLYSVVSLRIKCYFLIK